MDFRNKEIISRHVEALNFLSQHYSYDGLCRDKVIGKLKEYFHLIMKEVIRKDMSVILLQKKRIEFDYFYFINTEYNLSNKEFDQENKTQCLSFDNIQNNIQKKQAEKKLIIQRNNLKTLHQLLFCLKYILKALINDIKVTKREIYYSNVDLFDKDQQNLNNIIQIIQNQLRIPRHFLNVIASAKGLISGNIQFKILGQSEFVDLSKNVGEVRQIQPNQIIEWIHTNSRFILIIEKETVFSKIINEKYYELLQNCCIVTAKGYGDYSTKQFLKKLTINNPNTPLFYLGDCDAFGIDILFNYTFGSENSVYQLDNLPNIIYLGLFVLDFKELQMKWQLSNNSNQQQLSNEDICKLDSLLSRFQNLNKNITENKDELIRYQINRWKGWQNNAQQIKNNQLKYEIEDIYPYLDKEGISLSQFIIQKIHQDNFL